MTLFPDRAVWREVIVPSRIKLKDGLLLFYMQILLRIYVTKCNKITHTLITSSYSIIIIQKKSTDYLSLSERTVSKTIKINKKRCIIYLEIKKEFDPYIRYWTQNNIYTSTSCHSSDNKCLRKMKLCKLNGKMNTLQCVSFCLYTKHQDISILCQ